MRERGLSMQFSTPEGDRGAVKRIEADLNIDI
jgi:hypothetical protein